MSIKAVDLNYVYGNGTAFEQHALFDVNFEIQDGEFVGIIGHTGSGKSTLIQHLNGLIKASSGALYYNGENIYEDKYDMKKLRSKVGLVFQYPEHQLFEIDVLTDVCFGPKNQGFSEEEAKEKAKKALSLVGLGESYYSQSPFELSGGQKRRVAIAGVLAMEPEVLILDEPTAGLDPRGRDEILDQISKLHTERKMTIILVSHSMEDVARYAGRLIVMNHGQKVFDGTPSAGNVAACGYRECCGLRPPGMLRLASTGDVATCVRRGRIGRGAEGSVVVESLPVERLRRAVVAPTQLARIGNAADGVERCAEPRAERLDEPFGSGLRCAEQQLVVLAGAGRRPQVDTRCGGNPLQVDVGADLRTLHDVAHVRCQTVREVHHGRYLVPCAEPEPFGHLRAR